MSKVIEVVGENVIDPLLGSPVKKAERAVKDQEKKAREQSMQADAERQGARASSLLAVEARQRDRRARSGSASSILAGG